MTANTTTAASQQLTAEQRMVYWTSAQHLAAVLVHLRTLPGEDEGMEQCLTTLGKIAVFLQMRHDSPSRYHKLTLDLPATKTKDTHLSPTGAAKAQADEVADKPVPTDKDRSRAEWVKHFVAAGKAKLSDMVLVKWTLESAKQYCSAHTMAKPDTLAPFLGTMLDVARRFGLSVPNLGGQAEPQLQPQVTKAKPAPVTQQPVVEKQTVPAAVKVRGFTIPTTIPKDETLAKLAGAVLLAMAEYHGVEPGEGWTKEGVSRLLSLKRDNPAPKVEASVKPQAQPQPQAKPAATGKVGPRPAMGKDTVRPTQVRILKALSNGKSLSKQQVADKSPCAFSDVTYWCGSVDEKVNDANENKRNVICLARHGYVTVHTEQVANDKGGMVEAVYYTITPKGVQFLASHQD